MGEQLERGDEGRAALNMIAPFLVICSPIVAKQEALPHLAEERRGISRIKLFDQGRIVDQNQLPLLFVAGRRCVHAGGAQPLEGFIVHHLVGVVPCRAPRMYGVQKRHQGIRFLHQFSRPQVPAGEGHRRLIGQVEFGEFTRHDYGEFS